MLSTYVVYRIDCCNCNASYVEQTKKLLKTELVNIEITSKEIPTTYPLLRTIE